MAETCGIQPAPSEKKCRGKLKRQPRGSRGWRSIQRAEGLANDLRIEARCRCLNKNHGACVHPRLERFLAGNKSLSRARDLEARTCGMLYGRHRDRLNQKTLLLFKITTHGVYHQGRTSSSSCWAAHRLGREVRKAASTCRQICIPSRIILPFVEQRLGCSSFRCP